MEEKKHIFLSYSRSDQEFAKQLSNDLRERGLDIWMDRSNIEAGDQWDNNIEEAIKSSSMMILIVSPNSANSENVKDEVFFAKNRDMRIIPVLYKETEAPLGWDRLHWIEIHKDYKQGFDELYNSITQPSTKKHTKKENIQNSSMRAYYKWIFLAILILIGYLFYKYYSENRSEKSTLKEHKGKIEKLLKIQKMIDKQKIALFRSKIDSIVIANVEFDEKEAEEEIKHLLDLSKFNEETQLKGASPFVWAQRCKKDLKGCDHYDFSKKPYKEKLAPRIIKNCINAIKYNKDNPKYQYFLAVAYHKNQEYSKAIKSIKSAADKNSSFAQRELGVMYLRGDLLKKDRQMAKLYLLKAAENGDKPAQALINQLHI
jgi:hypothetical protein